MHLNIANRFLKKLDFRNADFNEIKEIVEKIFNSLSKVKGVEYTGASKIMHLFNKNLFVMWDGYIRKRYGYEKDAKSYLDF